MQHVQLFHKADTKDGYVAVISLRGRDSEALAKMGWVETVDELTTEPEKKEEPKQEERPKVQHKRRAKSQSPTVSKEDDKS